MEPRPSTPPEDPTNWTGRRRAYEADERHAGAGGHEDPGDWPGGREDWSARYGAPPPPPPRSGPDLSALFILLDGLRRAAPAELQERLSSLIREALLALRSLIDWYLERLDRAPREPNVEDIPIK
jgi:hypothetical protein